jgi:hypothetical protein
MPSFIVIVPTDSGETFIESFRGDDTMRYDGQLAPMLYYKLGSEPYKWKSPDAASHVAGQLRKTYPLAYAMRVET